MKIKIQTLSPKCKINESKVICEDKSSLSDFKNIIFGFQFDNNRLMILFSTLCNNCKEKDCDFLI